MTTNDESSNHHVGILALETYSPRVYVDQSELETHYGVATGKFTAGLGQNSLAVVAGDVEDVNSICLTVVQRLLEKYNIDPMDVGRLEVGTETLIDKSKSTKTVLMRLFDGNTDMEGATIVNACYGGTAALFNALLWCDASSWDGRYAIVVAADIAAYAAGPARPTSGMGAVAILIGRDAPVTMDLRDRVTHATHVYDFYKPDPSVEYPTVDGVLSQTCYYQALQDVYERFCDKMEQRCDGAFQATSHDYWCFHAPYNKLVQKSFARLFLHDARRLYAKTKEATADGTTGIVVNGHHHDTNGDTTKNNGEGEHDLLQAWLDAPMNQTYTDKNLEATLKTLSAADFAARLGDANVASQRIGNTYTASIFFGLASLIDRRGASDLVPGTTIGMFSYGSGALASMYRLVVRGPTTGKHNFSVARMAATLDLTSYLNNRSQIAAHELDDAMDTRARMHQQGAPYAPVYSSACLAPGTYYLAKMDDQWRRTYARVPLGTVVPAITTLAPPQVVALRESRKAAAPTVMTETRTKEGTAPLHVKCVITGTAAGLPGHSTDPHAAPPLPPFAPDSLDRLIRGDQCVAPISDSLRRALLDKRVVQLTKFKDGTTKKTLVENEAQIIKLAAQLGDFNLSTAYGVPPGLAQTMDVAAQVAVAAGMEALKNAGLVPGRSADPAEWKLPEGLRDTTGVVYASSFPAMDAAVGEVMRFLQSKTVGAADTHRLVSALRHRVLHASDNGTLSADDEAAFQRLAVRARELDGSPPTIDDGSDHGPTGGRPYEFDRKFLFRVLVLGNSQLAQLAGCRGPNTQTNAACAGTTQAIAMAQDMIVAGRAERVVVVAGDNASGPTLLPWLGSGFCALGAACTQEAVQDAALPFDKRRCGLLLGAGGIGVVLESEQSAKRRRAAAAAAGTTFKVKARLLATQYSNSAFHGASLDRRHIASELQRFLADIEALHGITKHDIAHHGVYFSHETSTHASDASSCAGNEIAALRVAFGDELLAHLLICNTKGFTGHPMGVSFEDVAAVESLFRQVVPPVPNYQVPDPYLGNIRISPGGPYACKYALRFAAGFGSQVAFALYATADNVV